MECDFPLLWLGLICFTLCLLTYAIAVYQHSSPGLLPDIDSKLAGSQHHPFYNMALWPNSPLPLILSFALTLYSLRLLYQHITTTLRRRQIKATNNCKPPRSYPHKEPIFGLDAFIALVATVKSKTYRKHIQQQYAANGNTFTTIYLSRTNIHTIEPENIKALLSTKFKDYAISAERKAAFRPLLGHSILLADGNQWEQSRALLRPSFARTQVADFGMLEAHVQELLACIPRDGATVDLADLFSCLTADVTTDLMFGESINSLARARLSPPSSSSPSSSVMGSGKTDTSEESFSDVFAAASIGCEERWRRGRLADLFPHRKFHRSVRACHDFIDTYVNKALQYRHDTVPSSKGVGDEANEEKAREGGRYVLLHELGKATSDREVLRGELLTIFAAGKETTASSLTNFCFVLARRPDVWRKLRVEVGELRGEKPSFTQLSRMTYLKACVSECMYSPPQTPMLLAIA